MLITATKIATEMKKKLFTMAAALLMAVTANAQFEKGKVYIGSSLTGLNIKYSGSEKFSFGVQAKGGYMIADNILLHGNVGYDHTGAEGASDVFSVGVGGRYYIEQNGIFLGVNCKYAHAGKSYDDFIPGVEVGYCFFLNGTVSVEPALYYDQSFKSHSQYSTVGLKVGVGIYLFKN
jgi:hypothetical protein